MNLKRYHVYKYKCLESKYTSIKDPDALSNKKRELLIVGKLAES